MSEPITSPRRRSLLRGAALLPLAAGLPAGAAAGDDVALPDAGDRDPQLLARDEDYWRQVQALYALDGDVLMLDNGYWGAMAAPVLRVYQQATAQVNAGNAYFGRLKFPPLFEQARARLAEMLGVEREEIAFTRGATEALQALIGGYRRLGPGDGVMYADTDYDSMISAMRWLQQRRGAVPVPIALPEPFDHDAVIETYARALRAHPRTKLLLLTQVNHRNGMLLPLARIAALARDAGVEVIVDAAHGIGQVELPLREFGADFVGINLHKWLGAPVGVGAIYIRKGRVGDIDPYMGERDGDDIRTRLHTGTANFAAYMAVTAALELHQRIGVANKRARLLYLRNRWLDALRDDRRLQLLASPDPRLSSAIASFRLRGQTGVEQNLATARRMLEQSGVFVVHRDGLASGACLRATPGIFNTPAQMDWLAAAIRAVAG